MSIVNIIQKRQNKEVASHKIAKKEKTYLIPR